jgi:bifunctional enzyme CysN/CysC
MVGMTLWLTGLSGSGKSTIAHALDAHLTSVGIYSYVLDADNVRHGLNSDLGFSDDDRRENVRRMGHVAQLFAEAGAVTIVPIISPFRASRETVRASHHVAKLPFVEVFVDTPLVVCAERDPKGLYAKQLAGEMSGLSGVDAPYEAPTTPEVILGRASESVETSVEILASIVADLRTKAIL